MIPTYQNGTSGSFETVMYRVVDGKTLVDSESKTIAVTTSPIESYFGRIAITFNESSLEGASITKLKSEFFGVETDLYLVNGTVDGLEYKDVAIYVYRGYVLNLSGTVIDGDEENKINEMFLIHA